MTTTKEETNQEEFGANTADSDSNKENSVSFSEEDRMEMGLTALPNDSKPTLQQEAQEAAPALMLPTLPTTTTAATPRPHVHSIAVKTPKETLQAVYNAGKYKAGLTLNLLTVQCFMAGIYIAMAGHLFLAVGGGILGAALFPTGLIAVVLTSAELFTGDALVFVASVLGGQVHFKYLLRNWFTAWTFNFLGSLVWAAAIAYASDALEDVGQADLAVKVALKKANQPWMNIFIKGIAANFMVCLAVWQATCAEEVAGKVLALWFPIASFVMMGFDHCIANQFLIPVGMMLGADISIYKLLVEALLPATLGNIVGGGIFIGAVYWYVYDSMTSEFQLFARIRQGLVGGWVKTRETISNIGESRHTNDSDKNE